MTLQQYYQQHPEATPTVGELAAILQTPRMALRIAIQHGAYPGIVYVYGPSHGKVGRPPKVVCRVEVAHKNGWHQ